MAEARMWKRLLALSLSTALLGAALDAQRIVFRNRLDQDNPPRMATTALGYGTVDSSYSETLATVSGVGREPMTWSVVSGTLPTGLSLAGATGVISGTPTVADTYAFTLRVVDARGNAHERALSIVVNALGSCTVVLNAGGDLEGAIASASGGDVICLNPGAYGLVETTANKASTVTIKSASRPLALINELETGGSNNLTFDHVQIEEFADVGATTNLTVSNSVQVGTTPSDGWRVNCAAKTGANNILFDRNTHVDTHDFDSNPTAGTARFTIAATGGACDVTIRNSLFQGTAAACSDGISVGAADVTVGPGNRFVELHQGDCVEAIEAIRSANAGNVTIVGNYFEDNGVHLNFSTGSADDIEIRNNVFGPTTAGARGITMGGFTSVLVTHNTFDRVTFGTGWPNAVQASSGWVVENNLFEDADLTAVGDNPGCGADCVVRYNLVSSGGTIYRDDGNNVSGTALYIRSPRDIENWANWQLETGSPGENSGNDGFDRGTLYYGS